VTGRPRGKRGPAPGFGAKGGVRVTVRLSDQAEAAVTAETNPHAKIGKSDVVAAIVEQWANERTAMTWKQATFADVRTGDTIRIGGVAVRTVLDASTIDGVTSILDADVTGRQMEATHRSDMPIEIAEPTPPPIT
jgi:hypothetical protein